MTDQLRRVFATALPTDEPPSTIQPSELARRGRRKRRTRRLGYVGWAFALTLATVMGFTLVTPGGISAVWNLEAAWGDSASLETTTKTIQTHFADTFGHDIDTSSGGDDEEPFKLIIGDDLDAAFGTAYGQATLSDDTSVGVSMAPPGIWAHSADHQDGSKPVDYTSNCWNGTSDGIEHTATCDSKDLGEAGLLQTAVVREQTTDEEPLVDTKYMAVLIRPDYSAVAIETNCGGLESKKPQCDPQDLLTVAPDKVEKFLTGLPKVPEVWED